MALQQMDWAAQFARLTAAPIDASQTIDTLANLRAALNAAGSRYYAGQLVSVTDDGDNTGTYRVTGTTGSLSVVRLDLPQIVNIMTPGDRFPGEFDWGYLWNENEVITLSLSAQQGTKAYIGVISDYVGSKIDIVRSSGESSLQATTTVRDKVRIVGEITIAEEGEEFEVTHLTDEDNTVVFITTNKPYFDNLCNVSEFHYSVCEKGFIEECGKSVDQYIHVQLGARVFCGDYVGNNSLDRASLIVFTGDISEYTHAQFSDITEGYFTIPLGSSTGGSAFNYVGSITAFPTNYATGDMWYISSDITTSSGITLVGKAGLGEGDFLVCLNAESNTFTVLQGDVSVEIPEVPSASDNDPEDIDDFSSSGGSEDYARADHIHKLELHSDDIIKATFDSSELYFADAVILQDISVTDIYVSGCTLSTCFDYDEYEKMGVLTPECYEEPGAIVSPSGLMRIFHYSLQGWSEMKKLSVSTKECFGLFDNIGITKYGETTPNYIGAFYVYLNVQTKSIHYFTADNMDDTKIAGLAADSRISYIPNGTEFWSSDHLTKYTYMGSGNFQKEIFITG